MTTKKTTQYHPDVISYARLMGISDKRAAELLRDYADLKKSEAVVDSLPPTAWGW